MLVIVTDENRSVCITKDPMLGVRIIHRWIVKYLGAYGCFESDGDGSWHFAFGNGYEMSEGRAKLWLHGSSKQPYHLLPECCRDALDRQS